METEKSQNLTIYTIGHSNHSIDKFIDLLEKFGITTVVDVRSIPYSRRAPQFNLPVLSHKLEEGEILYIYAGSQLGGFPNDPTVYRSGKAPEAREDIVREIDYAAIEQKEWYREGIERLIEAAREQPTVVMCAEEDPAHCHRQHLIAQTLIKKGIQVMHIRADVSLQTAWEEPHPGKDAEPHQPELY